MPGLKQVDQACPHCGQSYYRRDDVCNVCGQLAPAAEVSEKPDPTVRPATGKTWNSKLHRYYRKTDNV